eukprot:3631500-Pyramimonas_sp.AAC.1
MGAVAHHYKAGDLVDCHRPTANEDDWGRWSGPFPVLRNMPEQGQAVVHQHLGNHGAAPWRQTRVVH